jgi:hypothetical protein
VSGSRQTTTSLRKRSFSQLHSSRRCAKLGERVTLPIGAANRPARAVGLPAAFSALSEAERQAASNFSKFPSAQAAGDVRTVSTVPKETETAAWTSFCRVLFASAEFRYLK